MVIRFFTAVLLIVSSVGIGWGQEDTQAKLDSCVSYFEFGEYGRAADSLKALLPLIVDKRLEATAYKYLGFSYAMLEMVERSKAFFKVALEKFPDLEVDTLEVPPNILVIYKQVLLEKKIESKEAEVRRSPKRVAGTAFLVSGLSLGAMGSYFLYNSKKEYDAYMAVDNPDQNLLDSRYAAYRRSLIAGVSLGGTAAVLLPLSMIFYLLSNSEDTPTKTAQLGITADGVVLVCRF